MLPPGPHSTCSAEGKTSAVRGIASSFLLRLYDGGFLRLDRPWPSRYESGVPDPVLTKCRRSTQVLPKEQHAARSPSAVQQCQTISSFG